MSESTGGHLRKQPCALLQRPACAGAKTAQDAHPEVGQARQDRSHTIIHTMVTPGVKRHHALDLLPALPLLPSPALGHAVAPLHPGLALEFEIRDQFGSAVQDVGAQGAYRAGLVSVLPVPLSMGVPAWSKGSSGSSGVSLGLLNPTAVPSLCCGPPGGQTGLHSHAEKCKSHSTSSKCMEGCLQACNFYNCFILL